MERTREWPFFPRTSAGWGLFVLFVVLYGGIYYIIGFPFLWNFFARMEISVDITCSTKDNSDVMKGTVQYPRVVSNATTHYLFITLQNDEESPIENLTVWLSSCSGKIEEPNQFLPQFVKGDMLQRSVWLPSLFPREK